MSRVFAIAFCLLLCSPTLATGQSEVWRFRAFRRADGLAHDIVRDVVESKAGALYFATMGGITRYEPERCAWQTLRPEGPAERLQAMDLALGKDGALWVATLGGGVGRFKDGRWRWYGREHGLPSLEITALFIDREGAVWAIPTGGGIARLRGEKWQLFSVKDGLAADEMGRCAQRRDGDILCATYGAKLLQRFDGKRWHALPIDAGGRRGFYVHALLEDRAGKLWLATKGVGVVVGERKAGGSYRWTIHDAAAGLSGNRAGAIFEARDGAIWVATSAGLSRYAQGRWQTFSRPDGLSSNHVFAIAQARDGALWFATLGGGVSRYGTTRWQRFGLAQGFPSENLTGGLLVQPNGEVWIGTDAGIVILGGAKPRVVRTGDAALDTVNHLARGKHATWVATRDGVRRHDGHGWKHIPASPEAGPAHPRVRWIAARGDALYFATDGGVSRYAAGQWKSWGPAAGLPDVRVNAVLVARDGVAWAATAGGLARLEGKRWQGAGVADAASDPQRDFSSRMKRVYRLVQDAEGTLWASGLDGAYRRPRAGAWEQVPPSHWLPAGVYSRFVIASADGALYFAVRGLGVRRLVQGRWSSFTSESGLAGDTVRDVARLRDGSLLFATLGAGLSRYTPDKAPPETFLGPRAGAVVPRTFVAGQAVVLTFSGQDVLKDTPTEALQFAYRVDEGPWSAFAPRTRVRLRGLGPGAHRFEVRAMDRDLNVDSSPALHAFRMVRPWWREPWLIALVALSLLALFFAGWRVVRAVSRERAALRREQGLVEEQQRFVRLASHELRKPLTRMAHRAEMLAMPEIREQQEVVIRYAEGLQQESKNLARLVESLLDQARVQEGLELDRQRLDLVALVRATAKELESAEGEIVLDLPSQPLFIEADALYVQIALRNLLDNAQKYGEPPVELTLEAEDRLARVLVSDHGPGVPDDQREAVFAPFVRGRTSPDHAGFGLGLPFAREIARAHGGDLSLEPSGRDGGTRFVLSFVAAAAKD